MAPWIANFEVLISHWSKVFIKKKLHPENSQPFSFPNGMTLENRMKIEGARGKNVRSSIFFNFLVKTLGGYFWAEKVDFDDSKSKNGYSPMDSSSFRGKIQNLSRSFHAYQIDAHTTNVV